MTAEHAWVLVERTTLKIMPRGFDAAHRPPIPIPCGCHSEAPECRSSSSSFGRITYSSIGELARQINSIVRGWMQYYGAFYRTALHPLLERVNGYLMRWLRKTSTAAGVPEGKGMLAADNPPVPEAVHPMGLGASHSDDQDDKSPVRRDPHAGICGSRGCDSPRPPDDHTESHA